MFGMFGRLSAGFGVGNSVGDPIYAAESLAIFGAFTTPPTTARKDLIHNFVEYLKAIGAWALADAIWVTAAADSQAARINWKNPGTFTLANVGAGPTFVADRGYTGNGTTTALDTGYNPTASAVNYAQDNASGWLYSRTSAQQTTATMGNATPPRVSLISRTASDVVSGRINDNTSFSGVASTDGSGLFSVQRTASNVRKATRNGVTLGSDATVSTGLPNQTFWLCAANATSFGVQEIAFAMFGASMNGLEAAISAAVLNYMQAVGAA